MRHQVFELFDTFLTQAGAPLRPLRRSERSSTASNTSTAAAPLSARDERINRWCGGGGGGGPSLSRASSGASSHTSSDAASISLPPISARASARASTTSYMASAARGAPSARRSGLGPVGVSTGASSSDASAATSVSAAASHLPFEGVLKLYFKHASAAEIDAMIDLVEPRYRHAEQRRWIADAKEQYRAKIRMAFLMGDANGDGMLSLAEFKEAVAIHRGEAHEQQPSQQQQQQHGKLSISDAQLAKIFDAADLDGNGALDLDEFIGLVASHPGLMSNFSEILDAGILKRRKIEEQRLGQIFKGEVAVSPTSRGIQSPSGRRRRPTLVDLKRPDEVRDAIRGSDSW